MFRKFSKAKEKAITIDKRHTNEDYSETTEQILQLIHNFEDKNLFATQTVSDKKEVWRIVDRASTLIEIFETEKNKIDVEEALKNNILANKKMLHENTYTKIKDIAKLLSLHKNELTDVEKQKMDRYSLFSKGVEEIRHSLQHEKRISRSKSAIFSQPETKRASRSMSDQNIREKAAELLPGLGKGNKGAS